MVLDATMGQNAIAQATLFKKAMEISGLILTKLDGTAKGRVVVPIHQQFELPVKYIGVGEQTEDLALFKPHEFVDALFAESASSKSEDNSAAADTDRKSFARCRAVSHDSGRAE